MTEEESSVKPLTLIVVSARQLPSAPGPRGHSEGKQMTKKNKALNKELTPRERAIATLESCFPMLPKKSKPFANDLLNTFARKGTLSEKQWFWVHQLTKKTTKASHE